MYSISPFMWDKLTEVCMCLYLYPNLHIYIHRCVQTHTFECAIKIWKYIQGLSWEWILDRRIGKTLSFLKNFFFNKANWHLHLLSRSFPHNSCFWKWPAESCSGDGGPGCMRFEEDAVGKTDQPGAGKTVFTGWHLSVSDSGTKARQLHQHQLYWFYIKDPDVSGLHPN